MEYTIEIEENERTLEFQLDVECQWWETPGKLSGKWEDCYEADGGFDVISVDIDFAEVIDDDSNTQKIENWQPFFYLIEEAYKSKIELILEEDENLFETWKKHIEDV